MYSEVFDIYEFDYFMSLTIFVSTYDYMAVDHSNGFDISILHS